MKNIIIALLCFSVMFSAIPAASSAAGGGGVLDFFHVDNLSGSLSFDYAHPAASTADVSVTNLSEGTVFYTHSHTISDGKLSIIDLPIEGEGSFRLSVVAGNDVVSRDFTYLTSDYTEDFPEVTTAQVKERVQNLTSASHPYLFASRERFDELSVMIKSGTNEYLAESYHKIKETATTYLKAVPQKFNPDAGSYISRGYTGWEIVMFCSFVYLMERNTDAELAAKYAQRAYDEASYFCNLSTWGTYQYIDNNQLGFAVALCYDWLYEWLDDDQKITLANALKEKHLNTLLDVYRHPDKPDYQVTFYLQLLSYNNHSVLDNSTTVIQALAIADLDPDYSAEIMAYAMNYLHTPLARLAPDSGWYEGAGYWGFVGPFVARMIDALISSTGTSFGYADLPVIKNLGYFPIYQSSSQGTFVFCDAGDSLVTSPERYWFGKLNSDIGLQSYALSTSPANPLLCIWYDHASDYSNLSSFQKDMLYRNGDQVTMRSAWDSKDELFVAMSVNKPTAESVSGIYQNSGTFAIDAIGEQWIKNPGRRTNTYALPNYFIPHNADSDPRWSYYNTRAEANSCVVINPDKFGGQNLLFGDTISGYEASDSEAFAYANLTGSYRDDAYSYMRGIRMFDNRSKVLVRDEISLKEDSEVYSFLSVYQSHIDLLPDGSGVILSKGDKKMLVKINANAPFELSVTDAVQMDSSLRYEGDDTHPAEYDWTLDFQRLALRFVNAQNLDISMLFIPFYGNEVPEASFDNVAISQWRLDGDGVTLPRLSEIYIDGEPVRDFDASVNYHNLIARSFSPKITAFSDEGAVTIRQDTGGYNITVTSDDGIFNTYYITISTLGTVEADTYISGGSSESAYLTNYGSSDYVKLKHMGFYSQIAYYKLNLGDIPDGKRIKNISLEFNACRQSDSEFEEPIGLYLVDYNSWNESDIICHQAPVSLKYVGSTSETPWFPLKRYNADDGTYTDTAPDVTLSHNFAHTLPYGCSVDQAWDLRRERVDLTELYNKSGKTDKLAFCMAVSERNRANCEVYIASKEHTNAELRPRVLIELEDEVNIPSPKLIDNAFYEEGYSYFQAPRTVIIKERATFRAIASVMGNSENYVGGTLYVAQYNADGEVIAVSTKLLGEINTDTVSDEITILPDTVLIKTFVWGTQSTPFTLADSVFKLDPVKT